jgi:hypothetical protein
MMRMMTMSAVAGALLLGLASTAFSATGEARHPRAEYQDCQASRLAGDPAPGRKPARIAPSTEAFSVGRIASAATASRLGPPTKERRKA